ncbi:MAG: hypothetical protein AAF216_02360 [Pseudomonadota bacterium]
MSAPDRVLADLDSGLERVIAMIGRGVVDARSAFRWPVLSTQALDGGGASRIVVLRQFDRDRRELSFWTDNRSDKVAELEAAPIATTLFFDPAKKLQIRAFGPVVVCKHGSLRDVAFEKASQGNLDDYASLTGPGAPMAAPETTTKETDPSAHFVLLTQTISRLDVLELSRNGHLRAMFDWSGEAPSKTWVTP